ncbi:discoidin domain-containing protein [Azospirillum formosense]|uniref:galactose-binding domain-containing protein n=1 Tax=Azospirillum formosense TaxID=861533 RepID=UPI0033900BCC
MHVGAHRGGDVDLYADGGAETVVYVEPLSQLFADLEAKAWSKPGHIPVQALCLDEAGRDAVLHVASDDGRSSSVMPMPAQPDGAGIVCVDRLEMRATTVDRLVEERFADRTFDLLVVDTPGAVMRVLGGARWLMRTVGGVLLRTGADAVDAAAAADAFAPARRHLAGFGLALQWMRAERDGGASAFFARVAPPPEPDERPLRNVALHKPAAQSSVSRWSRTNDPQGAVNGIRTGGFGFHTDREESPWWQVDLLTVARIETVVVYNRTDVPETMGRLRSLMVLSSRDGLVWDRLYVHDGSPIGGVEGAPLRLSCPGVEARFVRLQLRECENLHVDEVEVWARVP